MVHDTLITFLHVMRLATGLETGVLILELVRPGNGNHAFEKDFALIPSRTVVKGEARRGLLLLPARQRLRTPAVHLELGQCRGRSLDYDKINPGAHLITLGIRHRTLHVLTQILNETFVQRYARQGSKKIIGLFRRTHYALLIKITNVQIHLFLKYKFKTPNKKPNNYNTMV